MYNKNKKAVFFSLDALIAVSIIIIVLLIAFPAIRQFRPQTELHNDILKTLSSLTVEQARTQNPTLQSLIDANIINDTSKTLLKQIGEFYVTDITLARNLTNSIFKNLDSDANIGLWFGSFPTDTYIASINSTPYNTAQNIETARQIVSGINNGSSVTGFSARAFLTSGLQNRFYFFGGYVGDGNITQRVEYEGNITNAEMELAVNEDFELFINGVSNGTYDKSIDEFTPQRYTISIDNFHSGVNRIELKGDSLAISGGFIKIIYQANLTFEQTQRYYFPGIDGLINIYDGFEIPGQLNTLDISLHINSSFITFLNIGNVTVCKDTTNGEESINLTNSQLLTMFGGNYDSLVNKTIPLRLGLENVTYITQLILNNADTMSVTDLSGSMRCSSQSGESCNVDSTSCGICGGIWQGPIDEAKAANRVLIDGILNISGNQVGLVGYASSAKESDFHPLSNDNESLNNLIDAWNADGATAICAGVNRAVQELTKLVGDQLIAYYPLEGNVNDNSGNTNHGTISGNPTYVSGIAGQALSFNGNTDYVSVGNLGNINNSGTITFWFKLNQSFGSTSSTTQGLWSKYLDDGNDAFIALRGTDMNRGGGDPGSIQVKMETNSAATYVHTLQTSWSANTWYHFAMTWENGATKIYVGGLNPQSKTSNEDLGYATNNEFGRAQFDTKNLISPKYLNGTMDDVRFYNHAISDIEIQDLARQFPATCKNDLVEIGEVCDSKPQSCSGGGPQSCNAQCNGWNSCEERFKAMVVMSDGRATRTCSEQGTGLPDLDAIKAAQDACDNHNIRVYTVGFGLDVNESTLQSMIACGGSYHFGNLGDIIDIYKNISESIIQAIFVEQTINATGSLGNLTTLYSDSYIKFNYTTAQQTPFGLPITVEKQFDNKFSGNFSIPTDATLLESRAVSYSGPRWTDNVQINGLNVYEIRDYNQPYVESPILLLMMHTPLNQLGFPICLIFHL